MAPRIYWPMCRTRALTWFPVRWKPMAAVALVGESVQIFAVRLRVLRYRSHRRNSEQGLKPTVRQTWSAGMRHVYLFAALAAGNIIHIVLSYLYNVSIEFVVHFIGHCHNFITNAFHALYSDCFWGPFTALSHPALRIYCCIVNSLTAAWHSLAILRPCVAKHQVHHLAGNL